MEKRRQYFNCTDAKGPDGADRGWTFEIIFPPTPLLSKKTTKRPFQVFQYLPLCCSVKSLFTLCNIHYFRSHFRGLPQKHTFHSSTAVLFLGQ